MLPTKFRFSSVDHLSASMFCFDKRRTILATMSIKKTKKWAQASFRFRPVYIAVLHSCYDVEVNSFRPKFSSCSAILTIPERKRAVTKRI